MKADREAFAIGEAKRYGLDPGIVTRQIAIESSWRPDAFNKGSGATGLMQITPIAAKDLGYDAPPTDPIENIRAGVKYLHRQVKGFGGDVSKGLAAYNWGRGNVLKHGMDKLPAETRNYLTKIVGGQDGMQGQGSPQAATQVGTSMNTADTPESDFLRRFGDGSKTDGSREQEFVREFKPAAQPTPQPTPAAAPAEPSPEGPPKSYAAQAFESATNPVQAFGRNAANTFFKVPGNLTDLAGKGLAAVGADNVGPAVRQFGQRMNAGVDALIPEYDTSNDPLVASKVMGAAGKVAGEIGGAATLGGAVQTMRVPSAASTIGKYWNAAVDALGSYGGRTGLNPTTLAGKTGEKVMQAGMGGLMQGLAVKATQGADAPAGPAMVLGAAAPLALGGANAVSDAWNRHVVMPRSDAGRHALASDFLRRSAADPQAALRNTRMPPAGGISTTGLNQSNDRGLAQVGRYLRTHDKGADLLDREAIARANTERLAALQRAGGSEAAVAQARALREKLMERNKATFIQNDGMTPIPYRQGINDARAMLNQRDERYMLDPRQQYLSARRDVRDAVRKTKGEVPRGTLPAADAYGVVKSVRSRANELEKAATGELGTKTPTGAETLGLRALRTVSNNIDAELKARSPAYATMMSNYTKRSRKLEGNEALKKLTDEVMGGTTIGSTPVIRATQIVKRVQDLKKDSKLWEQLRPHQRELVDNLSSEMSRIAELHSGLALMKPWQYRELGGVLPGAGAESTVGLASAKAGTALSAMKRMIEGSKNVEEVNRLMASGLFGPPDQLAQMLSRSPLTPVGQSADAQRLAQLLRLTVPSVGRVSTDALE